MWAALKSDLTEFVSTVAEDSTTALAKIDDKLQDSDRGGVEGEDGKNDSSNMIYGENGDMEPAASGFEATGVVSSPSDEATRLMNHSETFLEPLQVDGDDDFIAVKEFLATFDASDKTDDIAQLLEAHPDTLKSQFEELVPTQVTYEDFWQRYYFRCNTERICDEWEKEQGKAQQARKDAITGGIKSVKSMFGGAVKALTELPTVIDEPGTTAYQYASPQQAKEGGRGIGAAFFGGSGRPPFVMNTVVDDDEEVEEEEEEELGWDDDDEDSDDGSGDEDDNDEEEEEDNDNGDDAEQIEFTNTQNEEMKQQYAIAVEERDSLHETVEMQKKVIAEFQAKQDASAPPTSVDQLEELKMELFEKNAELAACKASLDDEDGGGSKSKEDAAKIVVEERERLTEELARKEQERNELQQVLDRTLAEMRQWRSQSQNVADETQVEMDILNKQLEAANGEIKDLQARSKSDNDTANANGDIKKEEEFLAVQAELSQTQKFLETKTSEMEQLSITSQAEQTKLARASEQLEQAAAKMDLLLSQLQADNAILDQLRSQSQSDKKALFDLSAKHKAEMAESESRIAGLNDAVSESEAEKDSLRVASESAEEDSALQTAAVQDALATAQTQIESLSHKLEKVNGDLQCTDSRAEHLEGKLSKTEEILRQQEEEFASKLELARSEALPSLPATDASHSTGESMGVKISTPAVVATPAVNYKVEADDDDDEGQDWGDDWSDDEA